MAGSFFSGMIDDVRIYNQALKAEDRRQRTEDRGQRTEDRGQKAAYQEIRVLGYQEEKESDWAATLGRPYLWF